MAAGLRVSLVSFPVGGLPSSPSGGLWFEDKGQAILAVGRVSYSQLKFWVQNVKSAFNL